VLKLINALVLIQEKYSVMVLVSNTVAMIVIAIKAHGNVLTLSEMLLALQLVILITRHLTENNSLIKETANIFLQKIRRKTSELL